jgi:hypothetical protein
VIRFKMVQEGQDLFYGELFHRQSTGILFLARHESQQQLEAIPVAVKGIPTTPL